MDKVTAGLRMAELLAARLCHELVSPVGAIANGVEILEEEPDFARDAAKLIAQSARDARRRLQFFRVAYGGTDELDAEAARRAAVEFFADGKIACVWPADAAPVGAGWAKLACNLLLVGAESLPRGGSLVVVPGGDEEPLAVTASGAEARLAPAHATLLCEPPDLSTLTPRLAQVAFAAALARRLGARVATRLERPEEVTFAVRRRA